MSLLAQLARERWNAPRDLDHHLQTFPSAIVESRDVEWRERGGEWGIDGSAGCSKTRLEGNAGVRAHVEDGAGLVGEQGDVVERRHDLAVLLGVATVLERVERANLAWCGDELAGQRPT